MNLKTRRHSLKLLLAVILLIPAFASLLGPAGAADVPPILDLNGEAPGIDSTATFTEDEGPEAIVSVTGLTIANGDDSVLTSAKALLTNPLDGNQESLAADPGLTGLNVSYAVDKGELTIKGNSSVANYQQVLRTLTYNNTSQSPDITDRIVTVTVSDGSMTSLPATSFVAINAVNDAPVLDNSGDMTMTPINEDDQNSNGNSVTTIIKTAEAQGEDRITDVDKNSPEGFAVVEAASTNGVWQYSLNSGINWQSFGDVSNTSAVLLDGAARIRFVPNLNFSGSATFLFRAWDQSGGRPSGTTDVDASLNGGSTSFSAATEMVTLLIQPVNDLPTVDLNGELPGTDYSTQFFEGSAPALIAEPGATIVDGDHTQLVKLTVTLTDRPDGSNELLAADVTGTNISPGTYNSSTGLLVLNGPDSVGNFQTVLRRITYANNDNSPTTATRTVTVVANDGSDDGPVATTLISVNPTNSAPVLDPAANMTMTPVPEDTLQPTGQIISQILATGGDPITDPDSGAQEGIAIIGAEQTNGQWQYSLLNPPAGEADWLPVGVVSNTNALLLSDASWLRFVPATDFSGESGAISFRAWDRSSGSNGQRVDTSINGGNTAFSVHTNTLNVLVTSVNDLPLLGGLPVAPLLYVEDASPLPLTGNSLTVTDVDSPLLSSAVVRLTNPLDGDAEWLLATTNGTGIATSYENGLLQLSGAASPAAYQTVLRSIKYWNASQDPDPTDRVLQISVSDNQGSRAPSTIIVQLQPVNDPPELDLNGSGSGEDYATTFYINRGPVPITADSMTLNDVDNTTIKSATVRIINLIDGQAESLAADVIGVMNIKSSYDPVAGLLTLTGADSVANYGRVLRTVSYNNILPAPDTTTRTIEFVLNDGISTSAPRLTQLSFAQASQVELFLPLVAWATIRDEEPNDTCAQAVGLPLNESKTFHPDDKDDWFFFQTTDSSVLTVELRDFSPGAGQIVVAAERTVGQGCGGLQLIGNNGSSATTKIVPLGRRPAGRYYIWVINDGVFSSDAAYRLYVRSTP